MPEPVLDHPTTTPEAVNNAPLGTTRELVTLAWPLILSSLAYTAVGFTDTLYMGRLGVLEVGAVGLASIVLFTVSLLFRGTLNAAATFVARARGAGDRAGVRRWGGVFLTLSLFGLPLALVGPWLVSTVAVRSITICVAASPCCALEAASTGTKAWLKAPSPKKRRNRLGMRNATLKASVMALAPKVDAIRSSRARPVMRDNKVSRETVDADLKRLTPEV